MSPPVSSPPNVPIRVLVVDDSAFIRQTVLRRLAADPTICVVGTACDGLDALAKVEQLQPNVVLMDIEMPRLDGLTAVRWLMERLPRPVIMFSSVTTAEATFKALEAGAFDFVAKPSGPQGFDQLIPELAAKIKQAVRAQVRPARMVPPRQGGRSGIARPAPAVARRLVVIGASTGGPRALATVIPGLPADLPAGLLIIQHMPAGFTRSLAERLDQQAGLAVAEARDRDEVLRGHALVAPGDYHLRLAGSRVVLDQGPKRHGVRPAVDFTLESAASFGPAVLAVILTGMGQDGLAGARAVKAAGGVVLAEAESTCAVYGMPRVVIEAGLADEVVPLDSLAPAITRWVQRLPERALGRRNDAR